MKYSIVFLTCLASCMSQRSEQKIEKELKDLKWEDLKIQTLLPHYAVFPSISPFLPDDFIVMEPPDPKEFIGLFWGRKEDLENFFMKKEFHSTIIHVDTSIMVAQTDHKTFTCEKELMSPECKEKINSKKWMCGDLPILSIEVNNEGQKSYVMWMGLNYAGNVLEFVPLFPPQNTEKHIQVWTNFVEKTTPLNTYEVLKSEGQDLRPGVTLVNVYGSFLKIYAQKRKSDGKIRVYIDSDRDEIDCECQQAVEKKIQCEWNKNKPIVQLKSKITVDSKANITKFSNILVLLDEVTEFTERENINTDLSVGFDPITIFKLDRNKARLNEENTQSSL